MGKQNARKITSCDKPSDVWRFILCMMSSTTAYPDSRQVKQVKTFATFIVQLVACLSSLSAHIVL